MVRWNAFTDKIIVTSQTRWFWVKTTFIHAICHKLEKRWANSFQDYPNAIRFNLVHLSPSMLLFSFAVLLLCCSTVFKCSCNVSFYFLGILGVTKLHHFAWHSLFKLYYRWKKFKVVLWSKNHFLFFFRFWKRVRLKPNWQNFELWNLSKGCLFWV